MKDIFKLYINGKLVDFELEPTFPVTYQQEDFSNPTIIKNSFSKTIKIDGTDNNNRIFGEIYNLDREQLYKFNTYDGAYFNPSKRTPFELYKNAELLESGYMQLTDITIKDWKITYNITLYGGLGDFFYSLMYNEDGEKKTLADLWYKIEDENGNTLSKETELDFQINKEFVAESWNKLKSNATGKTINDFICFAPSYNGLYEDFSNNTYLVNTYANQLFLNNSVTVDDVRYTSYEGYLLAKTEKEFTEWEVRDLRSYMQRPVIKVSKLIDAIFDKDNNGGYTVKLDNVFMNKSNPYYNNAYMALPLLRTITEGISNQERTSKLSVDYNFWEDSASVGFNYGNYNETAIYNLNLNGDFTANEQNDFVIDMTEIPFSSTINVDVDFSLNFDAKSLNATVNNTNLYLSFIDKTVHYGQSNSTTYINPIYTSLICQIIVYDAETANGREYKSNILNFTSPINNNGTTYTSTPSVWINNDEDYTDYEYTNVFGKFVRQQNTNSYKWVTNNGYSNFHLGLKDIPRFNKMGVKFRFALKYNNFGNTYKEKFVTAKQLFNNTTGVDVSPNYEDKSLYLVEGFATAPLYNSSEFVCETFETSLNSDMKITKKELLKTEFSPCDVLLDYCKLFGLYFTKDIHSKTINIYTKNSFFTGNVIDMNDRIDLSQEMKIKPFLFETKYYMMKSSENETYYSKLYNNEYNLVYGQKRIDTNYNFNKDTKEVYDGSVFQNAISVTDTSPYYKTFLDYLYHICPCWMTETVKLNYYNNVGSNITPYEKQYSRNHWINYNLTNNWNIKSGYDIFAKTCFYNLDNNSKSLSDINSTLLFFNGFVETKDNGTDDTQMTVPYWLTDDTYQMLKLNDNQVCYLCTEVENDMNGNRIAIKYTELPQFIRYYTNGNNVVDSFDFGLPKENYILNLSYNEDATLYNKFWKNYLTDRYNVNTKKISCFVNLNGMKINQESMRDFYYFNNCIWVANKIENYYPNSYKTTKVEFVKVNDIENYVKAQYQYNYNAITLNESEATIEWDRTKYSIDVTSTNDWNSLRQFGDNITPTSGTEGTTNVILETTVNDTENLRNRIFSFNNGNNLVEFTLTQLPSPNNAKMLYGYVFDEKTQQSVSNVTLSFRNELENYSREIEVEPDTQGYYEVWLPKSLCDLMDWIWIVGTDKNTGEEVYSSYIDWKYLKYKQEKDIEIG